VNLLFTWTLAGRSVYIPIWVYEQLILLDGLGLGCAARLISATALGLATALGSAT
jgi:hypothetical protein